MKQIYHITHIRNLPKIISEGRLWCDSQRIARNLDTTNIGHYHIKQRRMQRRVTVAAGGMLGEYVPFNFCPRSVMLSAIHNNSVEGYDDGEEPIVHLVSSVDQAIASGRLWAFTDRHAELAYAVYFEDVKHLGTLDWKAIQARYWAEPASTKEAKQAEFLVHEFFPWERILGIGVLNQRIANDVERILASSGHKPSVRILRKWYY